MGRPKQHDDATREALLAAAENLVEQGGTGALSVRAVADEIGTSTHAIYSTFGSKEGLLAALAKRSFDMLRDAIAELPRTKDPAAIWSRPRSRCSGPWPFNTHRSSRLRSSGPRPTSHSDQMSPTLHKPAMSCSPNGSSDSQTPIFSEDAMHRQRRASSTPCALEWQ